MTRRCSQEKTLTIPKFWIYTHIKVLLQRNTKAKLRVQRLFALQNPPKRIQQIQHKATRSMHRVYAIPMSGKTKSPSARSFSHKSNGSQLFDSFELEAVVTQLNHAIQRSRPHVSPSTIYLKIPRYHKCLGNVCLQNPKQPKRIPSVPRYGSNGVTKTKSSGSSSIAIPQLWRKVKEWLTRSQISS